MRDIIFYNDHECLLSFYGSRACFPADVSSRDEICRAYETLLNQKSGAFGDNWAEFRAGLMQAAKSLKSGIIIIHSLMPQLHTQELLEYVDTLVSVKRQVEVHNRSKPGVSCIAARMTSITLYFPIHLLDILQEGKSTPFRTR